MMTYSEDSTVTFHPYTKQVDEETVVIGRPEQATFLALPIDAVELLEKLAEGSTLKESEVWYESIYDETPDIVDLLLVLEEKGFIVTSNIQKGDADTTVSQVKFHFENLPKRLLNGLWSKQTMLLYTCVILLGCLTLALSPSLWPSYDVLIFDHSLDVNILKLLILTWSLVFVHEMAHLTAAQFMGVNSRLSLGNRMWIIVGETDMSGIWTIPKKKRYLPLLAGMISDLVGLSSIFIILFIAESTTFSLSNSIETWLQITIWTYFFQISWQCYFFLRTDLYYIIANFFQCKNLMNDTQTWMKNQLKRFFRNTNIVDQSVIPNREMKVIRYYAGFLLLGRLAAFSILFFIILPIAWTYLQMIVEIVRGTMPNTLVSPLIIVIFFVSNGLGLLLWINNLIKTRRA